MIASIPFVERDKFLILNYHNRMRQEIDPLVAQRVNEQPLSSSSLRCTCDRIAKRGDLSYISAAQLQLLFALPRIEIF